MSKKVIPEHHPEAPIPSAITLHQESRVLEISYPNGSSFKLYFEFLRAYSPSAEAQNSALNKEATQTGKHEIEILAIDYVGNYAVQPRFSDGHKGVFTWEYLHWLVTNQDMLWQKYLWRLEEAGSTP